MKTHNLSLFVITSCLSFLFSTNAAASVVVNFSDFSDTSSLKLNGSAAVVNTVDGKVLRITPAQGGKSGSAFSQKTLNAKDFSTSFKFRITNPGGTVFDCNTKVGADGFVFVVQSVSESIGGGGAGIGYSGINKSVGVEFDTWCNAGNKDPSSNHLGIVTLGNIAHASTTADVITITPDFDDGNIWYAWVDYNGSTLEVRTNQTGVRPAQPTLSKQINIANLLGNVNSAFIGFTSGTGSDWGNHDIISWVYRDTFDPITSFTPTNVPQSCIATYTLEGKLHIPYVSVPDPFGSLTIYEADMQLLVPLTNPIRFELKSATPRTQ
jgi:hypothetical protein